MCSCGFYLRQKSSDSDDKHLASCQVSCGQGINLVLQECCEHALPACVVLSTVPIAFCTNIGMSSGTHVTESLLSLSFCNRDDNCCSCCTCCGSSAASDSMVTRLVVHEQVVRLVQCIDRPTWVSDDFKLDWGSPIGLRHTITARIPTQAFL